MAATPNPDNNALAYDAAETYFSTYDQLLVLNKQQSDIQSDFNTKTYTRTVPVQTLKVNRELYLDSLTTINNQITDAETKRDRAAIILIQFFADNPSSPTTAIAREDNSLFIYTDGHGGLTIGTSDPNLT